MPVLIPMRRAILRIVLIMLCLVVAAQTLVAQSATDIYAKDRTAITQLIKDQQVSWNKGDIDAFMEAYWHSPDLTFSGASGVQRGFEAVRARYKKVYPDRSTMGQLNFSDLEFHFTGNDVK